MKRCTISIRFICEILNIFLKNLSVFCPKSVRFCTRPSVRDFYQFPIFRKQIDFFCKCLPFLLSKSVRHRYRLASSSKWKAPLRSGQMTNEIWMRICIISTRFRSDFFKKSKRFLSKYFSFSFKNLLARYRKLAELAHITGCRKIRFPKEIC